MKTKLSAAQLQRNIDSLIEIEARLEREGASKGARIVRAVCAATIAERQSAEFRESREGL